MSCSLNARKKKKEERNFVEDTIFTKTTIENLLTGIDAGVTLSLDDFVLLFLQLYLVFVVLWLNLGEGLCSRW
jgi:hypothetical protein